MKEKGKSVAYTATAVGNGQHGLSAQPHWMACPAKLLREAQARCAWCGLESGRNIESVKPLIEQGACPRHQKAGWHVHGGRSYEWKVSSLWELYNQRVLEKRRDKKRERKAKEDGLFSADLASFS